MSLSQLAVALLAFAPLAAPAAAQEHGKLAWFTGSFDEALAKAKTEQKVVFVDFWTSWCGWCKKLDKETFSDEQVAAEMKDVVCLSVDAESATGKPIAERWKVAGFPTLVWLSPDGSTRDVTTGYLAPAAFLAEVRRIRADQGTLGDLRRKLEANPGDIALRWELATKLRASGDVQGADAQMAEIKKLDPEGKSLPMRRHKLEQLVQQTGKFFDKQKFEYDLAPLLAFLEKETDPLLLFQGWDAVASMLLYSLQQVQLARNGTAAQAQALRFRIRDVYRKEWANCPDEFVVQVGGTIAAFFYEGADELKPEDKPFALAVAKKAQARSDEDPVLMDTLACCYSMNGDKDSAVGWIQRAIELDPGNPQWKERLAEFTD